MEIIDNVNRLFGDDLRATLRPGSKIRIAASTFSIFAFEALMDELREIDELQFVFTSPTFANGEATDRLRKEKRRYFIPTVPPESNLAGTEFEIRLRNKLTQKAIARECAAWIKAKVRFKTNATPGAMQSIVLVDDSVAYTPLQGFTTTDLGFERGDAVSNYVNRFDDTPVVAQYLQLFDTVWNNSSRLEDVTDAVHEHISTMYAENSPAWVFFLILSLSSLQLKGVEEAKIECTQKYFAELSSHAPDKVVYNVVTDYTELMQLVSQ